MVTRRNFLKGTAAGTASMLLDSSVHGRSCPSADYFALNRFVEHHPEAVFVLRTSVDAKTNREAIKSAGYQLGKTLFIPRHEPWNAFSVAENVVLKPNLVTWASSGIPPVDLSMGIQTDPYFVEGIINSLTELRVSARNIYIRDAHYYPDQIDALWYKDLAVRTGVSLSGFGALSELSPSAVQWSAVPNGVWYKNIAYLWPVSSPRSTLINIAKLKSHSMGMTLCAKNLQGTNVRPYVLHCMPWGTTIDGVNNDDIMPDANAIVRANYDQHKARIPRWNLLDGVPGSESAGGLWMETHATRCLDNNSVLRPIINIIEGIYGREGPFLPGPGPDGYGIDVLSNVVVFGKNALHVDLLGVYLAGHEPGNCGLFHLAQERGLSRFLNPRDVPLFEWTLDGNARRIHIEELLRTPLRTPYLPLPDEPTYHMVDQAYDYGVRVAPLRDHRDYPPSAMVMEHRIPQGRQCAPSIRYHIPRSGNVRLEVLNDMAEVVDILVDARRSAGDHLATWTPQYCAPGMYFFRMLFEGEASIGPINLE